MAINIPTLVKIRDGIRVNVSMATSHAVEYDQPQLQLKAEVKNLQENGTLKRKIREDDFEKIGEADVISFWFIGGQALSYRVGEEFTQTDFDRVKNVLETLEYRTKNDRSSSTSEADKSA